jgi:hypothetical protein
MWSPEATMAMRLGHGEPGVPQLATFLRLTWTVAGHLVALFAAAQIVLGGAGRLTKADALLWLAVSVVVFARWVEVTRYDGYTLDGETVSVDRFWRFVALVLLEALALWGGAHALGWALTN